VKYARQVGAAAYVMVGGSDVLCQTENSRSRQQLISDTLSAADGVFVVSGHLRERVVNLGVAPERVRVAYRGVDQQRFRPGNKIDSRKRLGIRAEGVLFLSVGRMVPMKGLDLLVQAAAKLHRQGLRFELALVGDGQERNRLKQMADDLGIGGQVRFPGEVPHSQLADWYRAADWSILTSHSEGVPNVLLESHACGTPFIATRVGGVPEIACEGLDLLADAADLEGIALRMAQAWEYPAVDPQRLVGQTQSLEAAAENLVAMMSARTDGAERRRTDRSHPQRTQSSDRALVSTLGRI
jgi:glycosyltransferase involved in cell wall biosynthesis